MYTRSNKERAMLPNLKRLAFRGGGVSTGARLKDAQWGAQECAICFGPLSEDTPVAEDKWPFPNDHFLIAACVTGHVYHKGCLRQTLRTNPDAPCPECRKPISAEVKADVTRDTPEEARARRKRERDHQRQQNRARPLLEYQERKRRQGWQYVSYATDGRDQDPLNPSDSRIRWTFWIKGRFFEMPLHEDTALQGMCEHFAKHMAERWGPLSSVRNWRTRLSIRQAAYTIGLTDGGQALATMFTCDLFVPSRDADDFVAWMRGRIEYWGSYTGALAEILGMENAYEADKETDYPVNQGRSLAENPAATLRLTAWQYRQWEPYELVGEAKSFFDSETM